MSSSISSSAKQCRANRLELQEETKWTEGMLKSLTLLREKSSYPWWITYPSNSQKTYGNRILATATNCRLLVDGQMTEQHVQRAAANQSGAVQVRECFPHNSWSAIQKHTLLFTPLFGFTENCVFKWRAFVLMMWADVTTVKFIHFNNEDEIISSS